MAFSKRSIFRESAIQKYLKRQEQGVLLRVISPPAFLLLWIVLVFFLGAIGLTWLVEIPVSLTGQGIITEQNDQGGSKIVAALFFSPNQLGQLHRGQPVNLQIGSTANGLTGSIASVETQAISPGEARQRFNLQGALVQMVTGPSIIAFVNIGSASSTRLYVGSVCAAQVRIGSQRMLSLLPGFNQFLKG
jgi:hypothetical protein